MGETSSRRREPPKAVLLLFNIQKDSNFGMLIRTGNALGVHELCVVGRKRFQPHGNQETIGSTRRRHFFRYSEAIDFYRAEGFEIVGVEIGADAEPVQVHPFRGDTAFVMGNEAQGLSEEQLATCDRCVYIPQYGDGASLNVNVACGIVLHHFAVWSGATPNPREGHRFAPRGD